MMARKMVDCEMLISGKWPERAEATKSKDGNAIPHEQQAVPSTTAISQRLRCVYDFRY